MGYPLTVALRYLASKKRNMVSISTILAIGGVVLGVAALTIVMSVTGGFQEQFREKVLGVNAHVLVLKYSIDFREYRDVMKKVQGVPHVIGVAPFVINPMMVTHGEHTATGVLLKGVDPTKMGTVLDLPKNIVEGSLDGLRRPDAKPPERALDPLQKELETPHASQTGSRDEGDAGSDSLLALIQKEVDEEMRHPDGGAGASEVPGGDASARSADEGPGAAPPKKHAPKAALAAGTTATGGPATARPEDLTPTGGYKSRLPDDDFIPDSIDPDPCKSPDQVARLPGIVVGRTLAKQLEVTLGDCIQVTSPQIGLSFGGARPPIAKQFRVIAVFEAGFDQYDSKLVYTDLYEAQDFYEYGDSVTGIEMKLDDIDKADEVAKDIATRLNNGLYNTMTWQQLNHGLFTALLIQKWGMSLVLGFIIVIAACTVIATLVMIVMEKKKEIALLKAIGATNSAILRIFLYQGAMIGVVGTAIGVTIGYGCCRFLIAYAFPLDPKVYFISHLPVSMHAFEFILPVVIALGICLDATLLPALHAAEMRPADGLRDEPADEASEWRIGEVLRGGWRVFWGAGGKVGGKVLGAVLSTLVLVAASAYGSARGVAVLLVRLHAAGLPGTMPAILPLAVGLCVAGLASVYLRVGLVRIFCRAARGQDVSLRELLGGADRFWPLLGALLLRLVIVGVGLLALVPGLVAALGLSLTEFYVVDRGMSPLRAMRASFDATVGGKGRLALFGLAGTSLGLVGFLALGVGSLLVASIVWIARTLIYLNGLREGFAPAALAGPPAPARTESA